MIVNGCRRDPDLHSPRWAYMLLTGRGAMLVIGSGLLR
jgi:hypothetical protein